jgi:hypothetical protein
MTTIPLDNMGTMLVIAPGALAGVDAGVAAEVILTTGRYYAQADNAAWLTRSATTATAQGVQLSPLAEGAELVVRGASVTYYVRARSALLTRVTFTRIGD